MLTQIWGHAHIWFLFNSNQGSVHHARSAYKDFYFQKGYKMLLIWKEIQALLLLNFPLYVLKPNASKDCFVSSKLLSWVLRVEQIWCGTCPWCFKRTAMKNSSIACASHALCQCSPCIQSEIKIKETCFGGGCLKKMFLWLVTSGF